MKNILLTAMLILLGASTSALAQPTDVRAAEAARALQDLPEIVNKDNARAMGFETAEEVRASKLGEPIPVFMVRLDQLRQYAGEDAGRLLTDLQRLVYPIQVGGESRATVELHAVDGNWKAASIGGSKKIRLMDKHRRAVMGVRDMRSTDFFEVRIPALNMIFMGHHDAEGLMLTPLIDDASLGLKAGSAELASTVFTRLVPLARATPDTLR